MVTTTDTTEIVTQAKIEAVNQPSFKRWLKHFLYMPRSPGRAPATKTTRPSSAWATPAPPLAKPVTVRSRVDGAGFDGAVTADPSEE